MNSINGNECSICIEPLINFKTKELSCKHNFHTECIQKWYTIQQKCPICRNLITPYEIDINVDEPDYIEVATNHIIITEHQIININRPLNNTNSSNQNQNNNINFNCTIKKKHLMTIINTFILIGVISSFTTNIFYQNYFINEIKSYIEYTNNNTNNNNTNTVIYYNNTLIDMNDMNDTDTANTLNETDVLIDYNNTDIKINNDSIDTEPGSDSFYIAITIGYMIFMLILTFNYISKIYLVENPNLNNHYIGFYIITTIMFCTHLYYIADILGYMNDYKYPNIKEYGDIQTRYNDYLITSMISLTILIISFILKLKENLGLTMNCCFNICLYSLLCCKCKCY